MMQKIAFQMPPSQPPKTTAATTKPTPSTMKPATPTMKPATPTMKPATSTMMPMMMMPVKAPKPKF